jgi:hypothetical protein
MSKRNRNRGKRHLGVLGKHDVETGEYSIECKSREKLPKWFQQMWEQTTRNCGDKIPLLVIHKLKQKYLNDWVIIKLEDFLKIKAGK